jgi:sodium transport system permease protein
VPAFAVTLPTVRLQGILLVVPVGNMVLLTRELFLQAATWTQVAAVFASTSLYAAAAVAVAARLFGQEAVLFADTRNYRTLLARRFFEPSARPTDAQALLLAALLFPVSFYAQSLLAGASADGFIRTLGWLAVVQFAGLFVLVPLLLALYLKIDVVETFRLRMPPARAWPAAVLLGLSTWVLALEFFALQSRVLPPSQALTEFSRLVEAQLAAEPVMLIILLLAIVPAVTEEFLFRGWLLSGVASGFRKWPAILTVAAIFGVYHFLIDRMPVTALMGVILAYVCWQSRSILPAILVHALHNGTMVVLPHLPAVTRWLDLEGVSHQHVPPQVLVAAAVLFAAGLGLLYSLGRHREVESPAVRADTGGTVERR